MTYGFHLWNFEWKEMQHLYVDWRKSVRKSWRIHHITHCKKVIKSNWPCFNSENFVVNTISQLATQLARSIFWDQNYRNGSYNYSI